MPQVIPSRSEPDFTPTSTPIIAASTAPPPALSLGYSAPLSPNDVRVMVEFSYITASGDEFASDPTFQQPQGNYWILPVLVGVRANFVPARHRETVSLYGGVGFVSALSGYEDPNHESYHTPLFSALIELRPEVRLSSSLAVWIRQRVSVITSADYGTRVRDINYSGATLQLGLNYRVE